MTVTKLHTTHRRTFTYTYTLNLWYKFPL